MSSDAAGLDTDISVVGADVHADDDGGVPDGGLLRRFAIATLEAASHDDPDLVAVRTEMVGRLGREAVGDASAVTANFNTITRIADATGTALDELQQTAAPDMLEGYDYRSLQGA